MKNSVKDMDLSDDFWLLMGFSTRSFSAARNKGTNKNRPYSTPSTSMRCEMGPVEGLETPLSSEGKVTE